jgi:hypothetical protein
VASSFARRSSFIEAASLVTPFPPAGLRAPRAPRSASG